MFTFATRIPSNCRTTSLSGRSLTRGRLFILVCANVINATLITQSDRYIYIITVSTAESCLGLIAC